MGSICVRDSLATGFCKSVLGHRQIAHSWMEQRSRNWIEYLPLDAAEDVQSDPLKWPHPTWENMITFVVDPIDIRTASMYLTSAPHTHKYRLQT
jgi:hypothetical protein